MSLEKEQHPVVFQLHAFLFLEEQLDADVYQEYTENIDDPLKAIDQRHAGEDEDRTHDESADNSPEKNSMLAFGRNLEKFEYQQKNEKIIDAKRFLDQIPGDEFQRELRVWLGVASGHNMTVL
jgi:hypothetical protein